MDQQVKLRGFRIELGEIEAILGQHPTVRQAVVTIRANPTGEPRLVAYVVSQSDDRMDTRELHAALQETLPDYMIPSIFVPLEAVPLTPNGKVDRNALPEPDVSISNRGFVLPRNATEGQLAHLWSEILGLEKVSIHDNFFELGGHSLLATRLISRLSETFELELPLRSLFEKPTIADLAEHIETLQLVLTQASRSTTAIGSRTEIEL
jgi:acyl carrier protein